MQKTNVLVGVVVLAVLALGLGGILGGEVLAQVNPDREPPVIQLEDAGACAACGGLMIVVCLVFWGIAIAIAVWVYKDAKARGENAVLWLLVVLLTGLIGLVIYLIVRPKEKQKEKQDGSD